MKIAAFGHGRRAGLATAHDLPLIRNVASLANNRSGI